MGKATELKGNKFTQNLSASDSTIKETRASNLSQLASLEASGLVDKLKKEKLNLEFKINNLVDMAPETSDSLRPGAKNFDATKWVSELHSLKMQIKLKGIELAEAEAIVKEWFTDSAE